MKKNKRVFALVLIMLMLVSCAKSPVSENVKVNNGFLELEISEAIKHFASQTIVMNAKDNKKAKAPGMKYTHYSPDADVYIVSGNREDTIKKINSLVAENNKKGLKTGIMCLEENKNMVAEEEQYEFYQGNLFWIEKGKLKDVVSKMQEDDNHIFVFYTFK